MKIGLYGGTFDPIHNAHLIIAQYIKEELQLNKVIFIPSACPPHKQVFATPGIRLKMVNLAIADNPDFECSEIEIRKQVITYSVDTIESLKNQFNIDKQNLFLLMGSDNLIDLPNWKNPEKIIGLCTIVVFPRSHDNIERVQSQYRDKVIYLQGAPVIEISSTTIRNLIHKDRSIKYLVPPKVEELINSEKLYR
ncbi:MAG: nicotinate-nucleotide adenylyltransferase [bacterium]